MKRTIQVHITRGETHYVAECLDLPVVTQGKTLDELATNIREAVALHLEGEDLAELGLAADPTIVATLELEAAAHLTVRWPSGATETIPNLACDQLVVIREGAGVVNSEKPSGSAPGDRRS
jgi:predicted RNase H-like HicB family nuclease